MKRKLVGIELGRVIAIVAVIFIHAYPAATLTGGIVGQLSRFAVPFFFLVSGYFFYQKLEKLIFNQ